jgi:hypothetical protein
MAATNPVRHVAQTLVQIAFGWPADDAGWLSMPRIRATSASEGCGQVIGEASLVQDTGLVVSPGGTTLQQVARAPALNPDAGWQSLVGRWTRILLADATGTVVDGDRRYRSIWHGVIDRPTYEPDGATIAGGSMSWGCLGLADALNRIYLWRGHEWHAGQLVDPGYCPVFNDLPGGDRSATTHDVDGVQVYVFERGAAAATREPWRARDAIAYALAGFGRGELYGDGAGPAGPIWELGAGASLLEWEIERLDMSGRTIAEMLNTLINPARGLTWRLHVMGDTVQIIITSTNRAAVTIGGVTIPAATPVVDDLTGDLWLERPGIQEQTDYYDWITVQAARPWAAITLWWRSGDPDSSLVPDGWTESDTPGPEPANEHRWRRWKLNPAWVGDQYPGDLGVGLRHTLIFDGSGASGARTFGGATPPPAVLEITRLLPYAQGFGLAADGPRQAPIVIIGSDGAWTDYSEAIAVTPTEDPAGLLLGGGTDEAIFLKARLDGAARTLLVTVGVREWAPYTLAWRRPAGWSRDLPRILTRRLPDVEQWFGIEGTVKGVSAGSLITASGDEDIRTDAGAASGALALLVARHGGVGATYGYGIDGEIDSDEASAPGTFVSDVRVGGATIPVNAVMTRRAWDFSFESYGTTYRFERLPPDVQSRA